MPAKLSPSIRPTVIGGSRSLSTGASVASSVTARKHVRLFSPSRFLIDPAACRVLATTDSAEPDADRLAAGAEPIEHYLAPLASLEAIVSRTHARPIHRRLRARPWTGSKSRGCARPGLHGLSR